VRQHKLGCIARVNLACYDPFTGFRELRFLIPVVSGEPEKTNETTITEKKADDESEELAF
jgi:hypothetical protein